MYWQCLLSPHLHEQVIMDGSENVLDTYKNVCVIYTYKHTHTHMSMGSIAGLIMNPGFLSSYVMMEKLANFSMLHLSHW